MKKILHFFSISGSSQSRQDSGYSSSIGESGSSSHTSNISERWIEKGESLFNDLKKRKWRNPEGIEKNNRYRLVVNNNDGRISSASQSLQSFSVGESSGYVVTEPEEYFTERQAELLETQNQLMLDAQEVTTLEDFQGKINALQRDLEDERSLQVAPLKVLMKRIAKLPEKDRPLATKCIQQTIGKVGLSAEFPDYFSKLPFEIIEIIVQDAELELKDLCNISETSRRNYRLTKEIRLEKLFDKHTAESEKSFEAYRKETKYIQDNLKHNPSFQIALLKALMKQIAGLPEKDRPLAAKCIQQTIRKAGLSAEFPNHFFKLPVEIIEIIFQDVELDPKDLCNVSETSRRNYRLTKEIRLKDKHTKEAENITSWEAYQKKIKDIQKDLKDYPSFQVAPLDALVERLPKIGKPREHRGRTAAFKAVVKAILILPHEHRVNWELVRKIYLNFSCCRFISLEEKEQWAQLVFEGFFPTTQQNNLSEIDFDAVLTILAVVIKNLHKDTRWCAFKQVLTAARQIHSENHILLPEQLSTLLKELSEQIHTLPTKEERDTAFEITLQAIDEFPIEDRNKPLTIGGFQIKDCNEPFKAVIKQIAKVPAAEREVRFYDLLSRIKEHPAQYSLRLLKPLFIQMASLPPSSQWIAFKRAGQTILYFLPEGDVGDVVPSEGLLETLSEIPGPEYLSLSQPSAKQIEENVKKIANLPSNEQWRAFKDAWQAILNGLPVPESNVVPSKDVLKLLSYIAGELFPKTAA